MITELDQKDKILRDMQMSYKKEIKSLRSKILALELNNINLSLIGSGVSSMLNESLDKR